VYFAIPAIIFMAKEKHLFDYPTESRKIHKTNIPNIGGMAIYAAFLFTTLMFIENSLPNLNFILASSIIMFVVGLKDDVFGLTPYKKFIAQIVAAFIVAYFTQVKFSSLYGVFGISDISPELSIPITIFTIVVITNSFNLIDGIDGLAGSIGLLVAAAYGVVFYMMQQYGLAIISFATAGSLAAFLFYNVTPAKIFMGDSGSYVIGFLISILTIQFIELNKFYSLASPQPFIKSAPAVAMGFLIIPLFDTLRIFIVRVLRSGSPFKADKDHLHHRLIEMNLNHSQSTIVLVVVNLLFIVKVLLLQHIGSIQLMISVLVTAVMISFLVWLYFTSQKGKELSPDQTDPETDRKTSDHFAEDVLNKITKN
jgi:UDP-GlcNAc:undecaprenyl-phosphate/decaprenyl-phosphate GlcNAc-1-phosphate transferase